MAMLTDPGLRDELDRVAAAVGVRVVHLGGRHPVSRKTWSAAAAVVLDHAAADRCGRLALPRRTHVSVLTGTEAATATWAAAITVGAQHVLRMPEQEGELVRELAEAAESARDDGICGAVVAVIGGRGGAGASLFAVALAQAAADALLVDLDPWAGGIDLLVGGETAPGLRWPDLALQVRLHAVLPPVATQGTCLSLRVLRPATQDLAALAAAGAIDPAAAALVADIVTARLAFLVCGGTGAGKTTLLAAMLGAVSPDERIVCVEDAAELAPRHPHLVKLVARRANVEGIGEVTVRQLVRQALRMRPDRIVVGEVRGAEVVDLLAALNTGHEGGAGTVHANNPGEVPARMEALGALGGLDRAALHSQLAAAVQVLLHVARDRAGRRRLAEIAVLRQAEGRVQAVTVWHADRGMSDDAAALHDLLRSRASA